MIKNYEIRIFFFSSSKKFFFNEFLSLSSESKNKIYLPSDKDNPIFLDIPTPDFFIFNQFDVIFFF